MNRMPIAVAISIELKREDFSLRPCLHIHYSSGYDFVYDGALLTETANLFYVAIASRYLITQMFAM